MTPEDRKPLEAALGRMIVNTMTEILSLPVEFRPIVEASKEIETVDGHIWLIKVEWLDFTGPAKLSKEPQP